MRLLPHDCNLHSNNLKAGITTKSTNSISRFPKRWYSLIWLILQLNFYHMTKKISALFLAVVFLLQPAFSAFSSLSTEKKSILASEFMIPVASGKTVSVLDLATMNANQLQELTGKKMNLLEKMAFKVSQKKLKRQINEDGTLDLKSLEKVTKAGGDMTSGFHAGGFVLGLLLGAIGVLIAYLINDDKKSNRVKWAWFGWLAWLVIFLIAFVL